MPFSIFSNNLGASGAAGGERHGRKNRCFSGIFRDAMLRRVKAARWRRTAVPERTVWRADRCAAKLGPVAFGGRADGPGVFGLERVESAPARADGRLEASRGSAPYRWYLCESLIARGLPSGRLGRRRVGVGRISRRKICGPATAPQRLRLPLPGRHRGTFRLCAHFLRRRPGLGTAQARPKLRAVRDARPKSDETAVYWPSMATDVAPGDSVTLRGQESACFRVFLAKKKYIEKYA